MEIIIDLDAIDASSSRQEFADSLLGKDTDGVMASLIERIAQRRAQHSLENEDK